MMASNLLGLFDDPDYQRANKAMIRICALTQAAACSGRTIFLASPEENLQAILAIAKRFEQYLESGE